jgi:hypothetical protein
LNAVGIDLVIVGNAHRLRSRCTRSATDSGMRSVT